MESFLCVQIEGSSIRTLHALQKVQSKKLVESHYLNTSACLVLGWVRVFKQVILQSELAPFFFGEPFPL